MERSISLLTFSGSIPEAITLAKNQKKLFVVYISGEDEGSICMDKSLWTDLRVAECIAKYCVLLHIPEGTNDATNFSLIWWQDSGVKYFEWFSVKLIFDPQKSSPCITAVGYTGVLLWQNDGSVSPENLVSCIEKAWLSLHIQETTATVLTAALSTKNNDQSLNGTSVPTSAPYEYGESSSSTSPVPSKEHSKASASNLSAPSSLLDQEKDDDHASEESPKQDLKIDDNEQSVSPIKAVEVRELIRDPATIDQDNHEVRKREDVSFCDNSMHESDSPLKSTNREIKGDFHDEASVLLENRDLSSGVSDETSSELLLNIRLPNGTNIQDKFPKIDALRLVKDYVDRNMVDFRGSFDLAIPYPRKVFKEQDLEKSLAEHGIINRQGFIVVPRQRTLHSAERESSSSAPKFAADTDASTGRIGGYFVYVRKMLSYVNPFSYLGGAGSSTSTHESPSGIRQYGPNSTMQNNISREGRQLFANPTNSTSQRNEGSIRRRSTSRIGANIHTLKHEEDDLQDDKNTYWNGNSTEFGGNDNDK
ncbi:hypothetical protein V2J09_021927 [Rumex salicifolius]